MSFTNLYTEILQDDGAILKAEVTDIINTFLKDISFKIPHPHRSRLATVHAGALHSLRTNDFAPEFIEKFALAIKTSVVSAVTFYPFLSKDVQISISLYTFYCIIVDDGWHEMGDDLKTFNSNLFFGQVQDHNGYAQPQRYLDGIAET